MFSAYAGGYHHRHHHHSHRWSHGPAISFHYGVGPYYAPYYSPFYPTYGYATHYPSYGYDYSYRRPNYAVSGTLLGALAGGLIGHGIHRQGWEGAGIGAAAGLVLGGLAERQARVREREYYSQPPVASQPAVNTAQGNYIANAPAVSNAPTAPPAPTIPDNSASYSVNRSSAMSSANSLFGR